MQSSFRGYLLTEDQRFLASYDEGLKSLPTLLKEEAVLATSPGQRQKLDSIQALHNLWINYADSLITAKKKAALEPAAAKQYQYLFETRLKREVGKNYNDQIEKLFNSFDHYEYQLREERRNILATSIRRTGKDSR